MNEQQKEMAVALANSKMIKGMTDAELARQYYAAKNDGDDVMQSALSDELARRGSLGVRAKAYFIRFREFCTEEQLDRVAAKFDLYGSLAVWAEAEVIARCDWSI